MVVTRASKRRLAERLGDTISAKLAFGSIDYVVRARLNMHEETPQNAAVNQRLTRVKMQQRRVQA